MRPININSQVTKSSSTTKSKTFTVANIITHPNKASHSGTEMDLNSIIKKISVKQMSNP